MTLPLPQAEHGYRTEETPETHSQVRREGFGTEPIQDIEQKGGLRGIPVYYWPSARDGSKVESDSTLDSP